MAITGSMSAAFHTSSVATTKTPSRTTPPRSKSHPITHLIGAAEHTPGQPPTPHKRKGPSTTPPGPSSSILTIIWPTRTALSPTPSCPSLIGTPLWRTWTSQSPCILNTTATITSSAPGSTKTSATTPQPSATVNQHSNILDLRPLASQHRPPSGCKLSPGAYRITSSEHRFLAQGYRRVQSQRRQCERRCHHHREPSRYQTPSPP